MTVGDEAPSGLRKGEPPLDQWARRAESESSDPQGLQADWLTWLLVLKTAGALALALVSLMVLMGVLAVVGTDTADAPGVLECGASPAARDGIPSAYHGLYRGAGESFGLEWWVLAAIGLIESGHGANVGPSSAGALGPMQFMPATWAAYGVDGDGDGRREVMNPGDAIPGAARLLLANGAPGNWHRALFAYNHADWYVRQVLAQAERYRGSCSESLAKATAGLAWPVRGSLTSPFCERRAWERCHPGIDIAVPSGTTVRAAGDGRVTLAQPVSGYGNFVCVTHTRLLTSCYAHLTVFLARLGQTVTQAEPIALSGCTGRCFGPHLHFEVRRGPRFGAPVTDPMPYLGAPP